MKQVIEVIAVAFASGVFLGIVYVLALGAGNLLKKWGILK